MFQVLYYIPQIIDVDITEHLQVQQSVKIILFYNVLISMLCLYISKASIFFCGPKFLS